MNVVGKKKLFSGVVRAPGTSQTVAARPATPRRCRTAGFEAAAEGVPQVVTRCRDEAVNLSTDLRKIIKQAGLVPRLKLHVNLRATRAVELRQQGFPDHVVNAWLGHAAQVAAEFICG